MGFFKDFKEDLSETVDEILPVSKDDSLEEDMINTISDNVDVSGELDKLDGLLESATMKISEDKDFDKMTENSRLENTISTSLNDIKTKPAGAPMTDFSQKTPASDENAIITPGMTITGDLDTSGSIEIEGRVNGNIRCSGKLTITGMVSGNSVASEVFADAARIDGEINAQGTVKVGAGSVVIGNITATSAVIAGAVKGDIDVQGPVVVDTSAVVMGNVKSRSVQINNGAVIEGFCSQAYADTDVSALFAN